MEINKVQWRMIAKGEKLPCDSFLMRKDGTITSMVTGAGVTVGQDAYYLPVEELRSFPKEESEEERIRKEISTYLKSVVANKGYGDSIIESWIAWLEKQGEHSNFLSKIQVGDKVTRNEDGVLVNLSQLKRIAKPAEEYNITGIGSKNAQGKLGEMIKRKLEMEKQGEQKPVDKVEPKFKVGDYVVGKYISGYISEVRDDCYLLDYQGFSIDKQDNYHLWTIADAKDGDVLADGNLPFIFKKIDSMMHSYAYCGISVDDGFKIESDGESGEWTWMQDIKPATKEQRDQLENAMADAGYTFDFDKKELKEIEQKSAWTEEDGEILDGIIVDVEVLKEQDRTKDGKAAYQKEIDWLKSLKDRVQPQPKQWSEEDEKMIGNIRRIIEQYAFSKSAVDVNGELCEKEFIDADNWLKSLIPQNKTYYWTENEIKLAISDYIRGVESYEKMVEKLRCLKPQSQWKPSGEQIEALKDALNDAIWQYDFKGSLIKEEVTRKHAEIFESLYNDLKKLREE